MVCNNKKRIIRSVLVFVFMAALSRFIHVDFRFIYNLLVFLIGVCFVGFEDKILKIKLLTPSHSVKSKIVRSCLVIGIIAIYAVALFRLEAIKNNVPLCTMVNLLGIIVLIILANLINFEKCNKCNGLIYTLSYLSMSFYLFHRFTYWLFLEIYKPEDGTILLLYLLFIAVPLGMCFAYYIQKLYDLVMSGKKTSK